MDASRKLTAIKAFHTLVWAFFASCIFAIPFAAHFNHFRIAVLLIAFVFLEVLIIVFNRGNCPLTAIAARYTPDRADNFDIFLPLQLARYNKVIFGLLFLGALAYTLVVWADSRGAA